MKGTFLIRKSLANGTFAAKNLGCRSRANDANLIRATHILRGKDRAVGQGPLPNVEIIGRFAHDAGKPILIACRHLGCRWNLFANRDHARHFAPDRFSIFNLERAGIPPPGTNTARSCAAGKNQDHVLTQSGDLRFHLRLGSVADSDHRDDRAHTNDNAERR